MAKATKRHTPTASIEGALAASEEADGAAVAGTVTPPSEAGDSANFGGEVRWTLYAAMQAPVPGWIKVPIGVDYVARVSGMTIGEALGRVSAAVAQDEIRVIEQHRFADGWEQANVAAAFSPAIAMRLRVAEDGRTIEWAGGMGWGDDWMLYLEEAGLNALVARLAAAPPVVDPFRTGAAGRPTAKHFVLQEAERRISSNEVQPKAGALARFAKELADWWDTERQKYKSPGPPLSAPTIETIIRDVWNSSLPAKL
jgi:hypothetical protein